MTVKADMELVRREINNVITKGNILKFYGINIKSENYSLFLNNFCQINTY